MEVVKGSENEQGTNGWGHLEEDASKVNSLLRLLGQR